MKNLADQLRANTSQAIKQIEVDLDKENAGAIEYITKSVLERSKKGTDWEASFTLIKLANSYGYQMQTGTEESETLSSPEYIEKHFKDEGLTVSLTPDRVTSTHEKPQSLKLTINWSN